MTDRLNSGTEPTEPRRWLSVHPGWILAGLIFLTLLTSSRVYLSLALKNVEEPFTEILLGQGLKWALWIPVIPIIVAVERRVGFERSRFPVAVGSHAVVAVAILVLHTVVMTMVGQSAGWYFAQETARATVTLRLVHEGTSVLLVYGGVVALDLVQRHRLEREASRLSESRLEAQLATERLRNLQTQLHPHFLFNALHAVAGLLRDAERGRAVEVIEELSDLLRISLRRSGGQMVELSEELDFLETYLDIQAARHGERLSVEWNVDPAVSDAIIPHLILQTLVENAVRHGIERTVAGEEGERVGRIGISARHRGDRLHFEVTDNGPGPGSRESRSEGIGLGNTRARLRTLYGEDFELDVRAREGEGTRSRLEIPLRRQEPSE